MSYQGLWSPRVWEPGGPGARRPPLVHGEDVRFGGVEVTCAFQLRRGGHPCSRTTRRLRSARMRRTCHQPAPTPTDAGAPPHPESAPTDAQAPPRPICADGHPGPPPRAESSALPLLSHHHAPCSLSICTRPAQSGMRASGGGGRAWRPRHVWPQRPHTPRAQGHRATPRASGVTPLSQDLKDKWRPQRSRDQCGHTCQARRRGPGGAGVPGQASAQGTWGLPGVALGREPSVHLASPQQGAWFHPKEKV